MELSPILSGYRPDGFPHFTTPVRFPEGTYTWELVDVGLGTADDVAKAGVSGRLALITTDYSVCHIPAATLQRLLDAGAVGVVYDPKLCVLDSGKSGFASPWNLGLLAVRLPKRFRGWPTHFEPPDGRVGPNVDGCRA